MQLQMPELEENQLSYRHLYTGERGGVGVKARNPTVNTERYTFQGECAPAASIYNLNERKKLLEPCGSVPGTCSARCVQGSIRSIGHDHVM